MVKFSPILLRAGSISVEANTYPELHHEEVHELKPNGDRMPGGNQLEFDGSWEDEEPVCRFWSAQLSYCGTLLLLTYNGCGD